MDWENAQLAGELVERNQYAEEMDVDDEDEVAFEPNRRHESFIPRLRNLVVSQTQALGETLGHDEAWRILERELLRRQVHDSEDDLLPREYASMDVDRLSEEDGAESEVSEKDEPEPEFSAADLFLGVQSLIKGRWNDLHWEAALDKVTVAAAATDDLSNYRKGLEFELDMLQERINRQIEAYVNEPSRHAKYFDGVELADTLIRVFTTPFEDEELLQLSITASGPNIPDRPQQAEINNYIRHTIEEALQGYQAAFQKEIADHRDKGLGSELTGDLDLPYIADGIDSDDPDQDTDKDTVTNEEDIRAAGSRELGSPRVDCDVADLVAGFNTLDVVVVSDDEDEEVQELSSDQFYAPEDPEDRPKFHLYEDGYNIYVPPIFRASILEHQVDGVRFMMRRLLKGKSGSLLLHSPGLGKTYQILVLLSALRQATLRADVMKKLPELLQKLRVVIICPPGLISGWMKEYRDTGCHDKLPFWSISSGQDDAVRGENLLSWRKSGAGGVLITSFSMLCWISKWKYEWDRLTSIASLLIVDEVHRMRKKTNSENVMANLFSTPFRVGLSGTPIANTLMDMFNIVQWAVEDHEFGTEANFKTEFCKPIHAAVQSGATGNNPALDRYWGILDSISHRRKLEDGGFPLPKKTEFFIALALTLEQEKAYNTLVASQKEKGVNYFARTGQCSLLLAHPFVLNEEADSPGGSQPQVIDLDPEDDVQELIPAPAVARGCSRPERPLPDFPTAASRDKFVAQSTKLVVLLQILRQARGLRESVLVFSRRIDTLRFLEKVCRLYSHHVYYLDGSVAADARQIIVNSFETHTGPCVFLISTAAGCVGLNLQRASRVIIFDFAYTPETEEVQAIARAYRMGQTKDVVVYWLMMATTMETSIQQISTFKRQLATVTVDAGDSSVAMPKEAGAFGRKAWVPKTHYKHERHSKKDTILDSIVTGPAGASILDVLSDTDLASGASFNIPSRSGTKSDPVVIA